MDCLKGMRLLPDKSVDLVITDPPYDVNYMDKVRELRKRDHGIVKHNVNSVDDNSFTEWNELAVELFRVLKKDTHCYVWFAEKQAIWFIPMMMDAGFKFIQYLIWNKNRVTPDLTYGHKYLYRHELCGFFQKGWKRLNFVTKIPTVIDYAILGEQQRYVHPTQKPCRIFEKFIKNSSNEGDLVLDPFLGSGTTAVAAKQLKRDYLGFELSQKYVDVAEERLKQGQLHDWFE